MNVRIVRVSSPRVTTGYGLHPPEFEPRWEQEIFSFLHLSTRPWRRHSFLHTGYPCISRGVNRPGRGIDYPPHLRADVRTGWSYTPTPSVSLTLKKYTKSKHSTQLWMKRETDIIYIYIYIRYLLWLEMEFKFLAVYALNAFNLGQ